MVKSNSMIILIIKSPLVTQYSLVSFLLVSRRGQDEPARLQNYAYFPDLEMLHPSLVKKEG